MILLETFECRHTGIEDTQNPLNTFFLYSSLSLKLAQYHPETSFPSECWLASSAHGFRPSWSIAQSEAWISWHAEC